jgi:uncharacterized metal-binding protein YceD (DUF177 family)
MNAPEFSRPVRLDQVPRLAGEQQHIVADEAERAALIRRFKLAALERLEADYVLTSENGALVARGTARASLAQPCVATAEPVAEEIDTPFTLRFVRTADAEAEEEVELSDEDCDTLFFDGESIDMGEAVAETVALALTPYPRSPDADRYLREIGVLSEEEASPFSALLALKRDGKQS